MPIAGSPLELDATMATILPFEPKPTNGRSAASSATARAGKVVIFPGVRIEREQFLLSDRLTEPEPDNPGVGKRSRRSTRK